MTPRSDTWTPQRGRKGKNHPRPGQQEAQREGRGPRPHHGTAKAAQTETAHTAALRRHQRHARPRPRAGATGGEEGGTAGARLRRQRIPMGRIVQPQHDSPRATMTMTTSRLLGPGSALALAPFRVPTRCGGRGVLPRPFVNGGGSTPPPPPRGLLSRMLLSRGLLAGGGLPGLPLLCRLLGRPRPQLLQVHEDVRDDGVVRAPRTCIINMRYVATCNIRRKPQP